ncbi:MAG: c-type cytochrome [Jhaorihella sp.]
MRQLLAPLAATGLAMISACATGGATGAVPSGASLYRQHCVSCHGPDGAGDGPAAADLARPPADLRVLAAANGGVFPAERVMATIHGYPGKDHAALMPEFGPMLDSVPMIWNAADGRGIPTPSALVALAEHVETLQDRPTPAPQ